MRLDCYFVANTLLPFNASSISLDFVHPVKEQSKLSLLYALSLMEIQIRILSSFFLFIMVFFCAFGLLFEMNIVPLCRHDCEIMWIGTCVNSHTTACSVFMLGAKCSQFFCAYGEMSVIVPKEINQFFFLNLIQYNVFNVSFYLFDSSTHYLRSYDIDKYVLAIVFMVFHVV